jgi:hypothetical protein
MCHTKSNEQAIKDHMIKLMHEELARQANESGQHVTQKQPTYMSSAVMMFGFFSLNKVADVLITAMETVDNLPL